MAEISPAVKALAPKTIEMRRDLHKNPELGFRETRTAAMVARRLAELGYTVRAGLGKTGVTGLLKCGKPGKTVLLRADIDALPIDEKADVLWKSQSPGVMHACGHDAHTAMALSAAAVLADLAPRLAGNIFFVFQPAEELLIGAEAMLKDGALDGIQADAMFAVHLMNRFPAGSIAIKSGAVMTSADKLALLVTGRGGHGASPHHAVDPIVAAAHIITALQTVVSREAPPLQPAVLSLTTLKAGTAFNIIPDTVEMGGTFRCFDATLRETLLTSLRRTAEGIATALRCTAEVTNTFLTPAVLNDATVSTLARTVATGIVGEAQVIDPEPLTGSDDVAYFWEKAPSCYAFIGSANPEWTQAPAGHNAKFDIDESSLEIGTEFLVRSAKALLEP